MSFGLKMNGGNEMLIIIINIMSLVVISCLVENKSKAYTFWTLISFFALVVVADTTAVACAIFIFLYALYMIK